jgi:hypothetical protein
MGVAVQYTVERPHRDIPEHRERWSGRRLPDFVLSFGQERGMRSAALGTRIKIYLYLEKGMSVTLYQSVPGDSSPAGFGRCRGDCVGRQAHPPVS